MKQAAPWLLLTLALAGCDSAQSDAKAAERRYQLVEGSGGSLEERCVAARNVADAWLKAEDPQKYELADIRANLDCNRASAIRSSL